MCHVQQQVNYISTATIAATSMVKLVRKAQADNQMKVSSKKHRQSSNIRLSMPKVSL